MNAMEIIVIIFLVIVVAVAVAYNNQPEHDSGHEEEKKEEKKPKGGESSGYLPYHRVNLLTEHERSFYKKIRPIAERSGLQIISKVRLADLVAVDDDVNENYREMWFGRIKAKHIDFAFVDDMNVILLVELDDSTHSEPDRVARDKFVDSVVSRCGYTIIHSYGETKRIKNFLKKNEKRSP